MKVTKQQLIEWADRVLKDMEQTPGSYSNADKLGISGLALGVKEYFKKTPRQRQPLYRDEPGYPTDELGQPLDERDPEEGYARLVEYYGADFARKL